MENSQGQGGGTYLCLGGNAPPVFHRSLWACKEITNLAVNPPRIGKALCKGGRSRKFTLS